MAGVFAGEELAGVGEIGALTCGEIAGWEGAFSVLEDVEAEVEGWRC